MAAIESASYGAISSARGTDMIQPPDMIETTELPVADPSAELRSPDEAKHLVMPRIRAGVRTSAGGGEAVFRRAAVFIGRARRVIFD
jgi:hypothetical protein